MKKSVLIIVLILIFGMVKAQEMNKNSISVNFLGASSFTGITIERMIAEQVIIEAGIGILGIGAGITYYPKKIIVSKFCPYVGVKGSSGVLIDVGSGAVGYVPLGITFFSRHGINLGMDIGPAFGRWVYMDMREYPDSPPPDNNRNIYVYGNLKLGLRF